MRLHVLVNLASVDIQMDNLRLFSIRLQVSRYAVAETHTDGDEHVAFLFLQVDGIVAMHTQHTHVQRMV